MTDFNDFNDIKQSLLLLGYDVSAFENSVEATNYLCNKINNKSIGIGGSVTVKEIGLYDILSENNTVYWHWQNSVFSNAEILKKAANADIYISSVNAIAKTGEIVNIDGNSNRVSAISFGHEKVYLIIGKNKISDSLQEAVERARNIAAPLNAKRLMKKTPCASKGDKCYNCSSPDRICSEISILLKKPALQPIEIVLIDENLGF